MTGRISMKGAILASVLGLALAMASCGQADTPTETDIKAEVSADTTIQFWHTYTAQDAAVMDSLVKTFESENPKIKVDASNAGGFFEIAQKVTAALQAKKPPQLIAAYENDVFNYASSGQVLDLKPYLEDPKVGLSAGMSEFDEKQAARGVFSMFDSRRYAFPWNQNVMVLYSNRAVLDRAGLKAPPSTWDEFRQQCEQIHAKAAVECVTATADASTLAAFGYTFGADLFSAPDTTDFGSAQWQKALAFWEQLAAKKQASIAVGSGQNLATADLNALTSGQAAFVLKSQRFIPLAEKAGSSSGNEIVVSALPSESGEVGQPNSFGSQLVAFTGSSDQQLATWQFIKFLSSQQAQSIWAGKTGNMPVRADAATSGPFKDLLAESDNARAAYESLERSKPEAYVDGGELRMSLPPDLRVEMDSVMTNLLSGKTDAASASSTLKEKGDSIVAEYVKRFDK